jgi:cytochrome P450
MAAPEASLAPSDGTAPDVAFDHHSPEFAADPWPILADLRERCPVAHSSTYGGFWVLTRYEDIRAVASDDETFSSAETILIPPKKNASQKSIPIEMDPPEFLDYRRILHPMFSPAAINRLEPVIERFAHQCIDSVIEHGAIDFVHDLADPLPAMTTLHKLGLPIEGWRSFAEPMHKTVFLRQDNPLRAGVVEQLGEVAGAVREAIATRRQTPRDDMITYLTRADVAGEPVTDHAVHEMIMLTLQGGLDTTGSAISNALLHLDRNREHRRRLIDDPSRLPLAVEELLRYEAPQMALARTAKRDVTIGGREIRAGERVLLVWGSGNRDDEVFPDPDAVVLDRTPNRHMTFGLGAHRCLGSTLARRMILVALQAVLRRMPEYEIDHDRVVRAETIGVTYGTFALPASFPAGERWFAW